VAESGVAMRDIAWTIAEGLGVPTLSLAAGAAAAHFGPMALFASLDLIASSDATRAELGWQPTGPGLPANLRDMDYGRTV
jgi:nucleoside-diphosphate-sugar epimerase